MHTRLIFSYLKRYRMPLIWMFVLYVISTLCGLFLPYVMSDIVNTGIAGGDIPYILRRGGIMLVLAVLALGSGIVSTK